MNNRNRNISHNDDVLRDLSDRLYWDKINEHTCKDPYKDNPECEHCKEKDIVIDLRKVPCHQAFLTHHLSRLCWHDDGVRFGVE